ncbi:hypothetical protein [Ferruginibacter sp.]
MNTKIITQLEALFEAAPPESLRRSINHVFYNYLMHSKAAPQQFWQYNRRPVFFSVLFRKCR